MNKISRILVVIYADPEGFPPTINAIESIATFRPEIKVIYRPISSLNTHWEYPKNVFLFPVGKDFGLKSQMLGSIFLKAFLYLSFLLIIIKNLISFKPQLVIIYDPVALAIFNFARTITNFKGKTWYHNHDILESNDLKKYSFKKVVIKIEKKAFRWLDIFSLPSREREIYFPLKSFRGKYFYIPNYPMVKHYQRFWNEKKYNDKIILIFQGYIGPGHGIEEILSILGYDPETRKPLILYLKGTISEIYKLKLQKLINEYYVNDFVIFYPFTEYVQVPKISSSCHIGIAVHKGSDIMNKTLGSASNKIYEYAAVGLPVIYFENEHFKQYLGNQSWAFPTDLSKYSLKSNIKNIMENYSELSENAKEAFINNFNFEKQIIPVLNNVFI